MPLFGVRKFLSKLDRVAKVSESKKLWHKVGLQGKDIIVQRTLKGKDFKGNAFRPYTPSYYKWKKERGKHGFTGVNLNNAGNMLASMQVSPTARKAVLFFSKTEEAKKAASHHLGLGNPKREFFDFSPMEIKRLLNIVAKEQRAVAR